MFPERREQDVRVTLHPWLISGMQQKQQVGLIVTETISDGSCVHR